MLTSSQLQYITGTIVKYYFPDRIILFGSFAKETNNIRSDIDLAIIKDTCLPKKERGRTIRNVFSVFPIPLDLHFYTLEEFNEGLAERFSFEDSINMAGKVIYDRHSQNFKIRL